MEQTILESLKGLNGEIKATNKSARLNFEYDGCVKIERGNFSGEISFYAKVYETKHKGVVSIDDWDIHSSDNYALNGLAILHISTFRTKISDWGLSLEKLNFSTDEEKRAIGMVMLEDETLKKIFGKKFKVWSLLSLDEQKLLELQLVIEKFESIGEHIKNQVATHYKIGVQPTIPTLEEFELKLVELSK